MVILGGMILFPFNIKYKIRDQGPEKKIFFIFFFACLERGKFLLTKKKIIKKSGHLQQKSIPWVWRLKNF